ncbi:MAG: glycosyltransferase family 2 protein [Candidatus Peribacteraceae bacterium]
MRIAAVIPAYNEAQRVAAVIRESSPYVEAVYVIDDGSADDTAAVAAAAGAVVLRHPLNCGAGAATMTGLVAVREKGFDAAVTIDADGQHAPSDIPRLIAEIERGADLAIANRFGSKSSIPFIRKVFNSIGNGVTFLVTGIFLPDTQCGFKVFGPKALKEVELKMSGFEFCTEIIGEAARHKWKIVSIPSKVVYSEYTLAKGQSFANGIKTAAKILLRTFLR